MANPVVHRAPGSARRVGTLVLALALVAAAVPAAELRLRGLRGETLDEAALAQGVVIAVVWASWSPRGRDVADRVNRIHDRWGQQARVVTVNFQEDAETVRQFLEGKDLKVPVFLDSGNAEFSKRYNVTRVPRLLVFRDGVTTVNVNLPDDPDPVIANAFGN